MINHVRNGTSKQTLLDKHGHVLGLNDVNLDIPAGEIQVIMGLSGSGKSTLIRHFNRLIEPTAGEIIVDGRNVIEMDKNELNEYKPLVRQNEIHIHSFFIKIRYLNFKQ